MNVLKIICVMLLSIIVIIGFYGFFFGPLFPWCPIKPGFSETKLTRCIIIYPKNSPLFPEYEALDDLMAETECFHKLQFRKRLRIIVCATNEQYRRFSMSGGHACAIQTGTVIYIRPSIRETTYPPSIQVDGGNLRLLSPAEDTRRDMTGFLKHELSHAILYQNTSLLKAPRIKSWVEEGLAVYFGNPHHYYRDSEFRTLAIDQGCFFNLLEDHGEPKAIPKEIKYFFIYGAYHEFMKYLIQEHGLDTVLAYTHAYIKAPKKEVFLFKSFFRNPPQNELECFRQHISNR